MKKAIFIVIGVLICISLIFGFSFLNKKGNKKYSSDVVQTEYLEKSNDTENNYLATFVELGSVNCMPCKMMQPVMDEIEQEYGDKVKVVFYDVWTEEGKSYAGQYGIRVIPTQIFLDKQGREYYRHEGFFPKEEIENVLAQGGVPINTTNNEAEEDTQSEIQYGTCKTGTICQ